MATARGLSHGPWVTSGDFKLTRHVGENKNNTRTRRTRDMWSFLEQIKELGLIGSFFT